MEEILKTTTFYKVVSHYNVWNLMTNYGVQLVEEQLNAFRSVAYILENP